MRASELLDGLIGGKALAGQDPRREPTAASMGAASVPGRRVSNRASRRHSQAYGGTDAIDWVMDCVDLYAQTASSAEYHFERDGTRLSGGLASDRTDDARAPDDLISLIKRPNPYQDWTEFIELAVIDLLLTGEFLWWKFKPNAQGQPVALYRMPPSLTEIEPKPNNLGIKHYLYRAPGSSQGVTLPADQVVHVKRPNPHDNFRGLGVIAGAPRVFDIELALVEQSATYYEQGTKLTGVIESDKTVTPGAMEIIKERWRSLYAGPRNAGAVAALERGMSFKTISATAVEAQLEKMGNVSKERIAAMFRVPLPILGFVGGSTDRQAVREAQRIFDNKTMRLFLNRVQSQISNGLTQAWGVDFVFDHEYVMPIEDRLDLGEALAALPGVRVREVREQVGLAPLAEDDPSLKEIDDMILNLPGAPREEGGHPDPNLGEEGGRPPHRENTRAFPKPGEPTPASAAAASPTELRRQIRNLRGRLNGTS